MELARPDIAMVQRIDSTYFLNRGSFATCDNSKMFVDEFTPPTMIQIQSKLAPEHA